VTFGPTVIDVSVAARAALGSIATAIKDDTNSCHAWRDTEPGNKYFRNIQSSKNNFSFELRLRVQG
jgi:hypothetical protein